MKKLGIALTLVPEPLETELKSLLPFFSMVSKYTWNDDIKGNKSYDDSVKLKRTEMDPFGLC